MDIELQQKGWGGVIQGSDKTGEGELRKQRICFIGRNKDSVIQKKSRSKSIWFWSQFIIILIFIIISSSNSSFSGGSGLNTTEEVLQVLGY